MKGVLQNKKVLLTGATGQVGYELRSRLCSQGNLWAPPRNEFDMSDPESLRGKVRRFQPDVILNAAACTAVDQVELEPELSYAVNTAAPRVLAEEAQKLSIPLIHYSTDYVFDGAKAEPYEEEDATNPLNVYGRTKLAAEQAIHEAHDQYLIFRTSWVYSLKGKNFLTTMLRLFEEREEISVVDDQFGAPTSAATLAEATGRILDQLRSKEEGENRWGLYHLTAKGQTNWHEFAQEIMKRAKEQKEFSIKLRIKGIVPIPTSDYPTPARRPRNSRLDTSKVVQGFQIELSSWQNGLLTHDLSYNN